MDFHLDPYFEHLDKPTDSASDDLLKGSLARHGCVYPLIVWKEQNVLIDGYRRLRLCGEDVPYKFLQRSFKSRDEAEHWVKTQQAYRRNLDEIDLHQARKKAKELLAKLAASHDGEPPTRVMTNEPNQQVVSKIVPPSQVMTNVTTPTGGESISAIAKKTGVSTRTVARAIKKDRESKEPQPTAVVAAPPDEPREEDRLADLVGEIVKSINAALRGVKKLRDEAGMRSHWTRSVDTRVVHDLEDARSALNSVIPQKHAKCNGEGCGGCDDRGWVIKGINQGER